MMNLSHLNDIRLFFLYKMSNIFPEIIEIRVIGNDVEYYFSNRFMVTMSFYRRDNAVTSHEVMADMVFIEYKKGAIANMKAYLLDNARFRFLVSSY